MTQPAKPIKVLVYSDDVTVRQQVISAFAGWQESLECVEVATEAVVLQQARSGEASLLVLDGQAVPAGGFVVAKEVTTVPAPRPPVIVLTSRPEDAGLAACSGADASVAHPVDPAELAHAAEGLLRGLVEA